MDKMVGSMKVAVITRLWSGKHTQPRQLSQASRVRGSKVSTELVG